MQKKDFSPLGTKSLSSLLLFCNVYDHHTLSPPSALDSFDLELHSPHGTVLAAYPSSLPVRVMCIR
jgi:hypothetical protein